MKRICMKSKWHSKSIRKWIKRLRKRLKSKSVHDPNDKSHELKELHPESCRLKDFDWQGMITLKFHSSSYSKNDLRGIGSKNRFAFVEAYMNNLRNKFRLSDREFIWVACEEFGKSGMGHVHIIFSFDYLRRKHRADKIPRIDFSESGHFPHEANEAKDYICRRLQIQNKSVDVKWSTQYHNEGLVNYFSKVEFDKHEKFFLWSPNKFVFGQVTIH